MTQQLQSQGKLYIVGTPIGNLGDLSPRAVEILRMVDFIAAEDTRVTLKLLNHFDIKKPMVSYHEHNLRQRGEYILSRICAGESCAAVSDAGMPCISDPGEDLVRLCAQQGIEAVVVPGPSAAISGLALSGLSTSRFAFEGFLSTNKKSRQEHLASLVHDTHTLIFYEAPHKLCTTLRDLKDCLGNRRITLARELTKLHEEVRRTTLAEACDYYELVPPKGEFVLIVEGYVPSQEEDGLTLDEAVAQVRQRVQDGEKLSDACKNVAAQTGFRKGELYTASLQKG